MVLLISQLPIPLSGAPRACGDVIHVHSSSLPVLSYVLEPCLATNAARVRTNNVVAVQIIPTVRTGLSKGVRLA